ncbi:MAG: cytochrome c oxidase accessory protein CcoG [Calditrichaeota bacterium]|nr:MAG: cytochrome c oxidase accessory protein CcoG [Calditrichota bacterium]
MIDDKTVSAPDFERDESFRDTIGTVDKAGKRVWITPKKPKGKFYTARIWTTLVLLALLFSGPFIRIGGQPLLLLNFFERKFVIFGAPFWPQDFHLFALLLLSFVIFIVTFTAVFGRVWCGWACPQTVFMEMVFRKIEYWIEGDGNKQRKLNAAPMSFSKFFKKTSKHIIFFAIAFLIGNTFMAYIVGSEAWWEIVTQPPSAHLSGFSAVVIFSGIFYFVFAYFREQACVIVCPYGRFQSVLLDKASIVISYDFKRGEPRGKISKKNPNAKLGDCIDCHQCVDVCPTGIDIRNGTQLECVNCTACIDACDSVMTKIKRPKGLIRFSSYNAIKTGEHRKITPRVMGYSIVLVLIIGIFISVLLTRNPIETTVLRTPGVLYQKTESGGISNVYQFKIVNKTFDDMAIHFTLKDKKAVIRLNQNILSVPKNKLFSSTMVIELPRTELEPGRNKITLEVWRGDVLLEEVDTTFQAPAEF